MAALSVCLFFVSPPILLHWFGTGNLVLLRTKVDSPLSVTFTTSIHAFARSGVLLSFSPPPPFFCASLLRQPTVPQQALQQFRFTAIAYRTAPLHHPTAPTYRTNQRHQPFYSSISTRLHHKRQLISKPRLRGAYDHPITYIKPNL